VVDDDDDDNGGEPDIRVDPPQILMQVDVLTQATHDLRIFNDGNSELIIVGVTQLIAPAGIDGSTFSGAIAVGDYHDLVPAIEVDCHTTGLLQDTLQIEHNDLDENPTEVSVTIACVDPK